MVCLKRSRLIFSLVILVSFFRESVQVLDNFRLPYCNSVLNDRSIVQNPLRVYLSIFRSLFCIVGTPTDSFETTGYQTETDALNAANAQIQALASTSSGGTCSAGKSALSNVRISIILNGSPIALSRSTSSYTQNTDLYGGVSYPYERLITTWFEVPSKQRFRLLVLQETQIL